MAKEAQKITNGVPPVTKASQVSTNREAFDGKRHRKMELLPIRGDKLFCTWYHKGWVAYTIIVKINLMSQVSDVLVLFQQCLHFSTSLDMSVIQSSFLTPMSLALFGPHFTKERWGAC